MPNDTDEGLKEIKSEVGEGSSEKETRFEKIQRVFGVAVEVGLSEELARTAHSGSTQRMIVESDTLVGAQAAVADNKGNIHNDSFEQFLREQKADLASHEDAVVAKIRLMQIVRGYFAVNFLLNNGWAANDLLYDLATETGWDKAETVASNVEFFSRVRSELPELDTYDAMAGRYALSSGLRSYGYYWDEEKKAYQKQTRR